MTITASNSMGSPASQDFILTVTSAASAPAITSSPATTETFGVPFSFAVTTTGYPAPKVTKTGPLPQGVRLTNNGDGTTTISGTPSKSAIGVYPVTLTAKSAAGTTTQAFRLTITKAPVIKHIPATRAHVGAALNLVITAKGYTTPALTESGTLPSGLNFTDSGNGTATITGRPAPGSGGSYQITITATNQLGTTSQTFTLKVDEAPAITSPRTASGVVGSAFSFRVTAAGFPAPKITETGSLPKGLTFHPGAATLSGTPKAGTSGTDPIVFTATNRTGVNSQNFTLTVTQ
jgi:large repetitive protein